MPTIPNAEFDQVPLLILLRGYLKSGWLRFQALVEIPSNPPSEKRGTAPKLNGSSPS